MPMLVSLPSIRRYGVEKRSNCGQVLESLSGIFLESRLQFVVRRVGKIVESIETTIGCAERSSPEVHFSNEANGSRIVTRNILLRAWEDFLWPSRKRGLVLQLKNLSHIHLWPIRITRANGSGMRGSIQL